MDPRPSGFHEPGFINRMCPSNDQLSLLVTRYLHTIYAFLMSLFIDVMDYQACKDRMFSCHLDPRRSIDKRESYFTFPLSLTYWPITVQPIASLSFLITSVI